MKKEQFYPLGIFLAAMLGGLVRYLVSTWLPASPDFPWGTLFVNYLGIFCLIYLVKGYLVYKGTSKGLILALGTGFCGGLTTFSSLMLDTYTPEMNPIEQVWKEIRKRGFKNKAFQTLEDVMNQL
ncbi:CrcB protein [Streptococcus pneumoniae]|nr:CrcB protein [Streptococcus pneumoniae]